METQATQISVSGRPAAPQVHSFFGLLDHMGCVWLGAKVLVGHLDTEPMAFAPHQLFISCESGRCKACKPTRNVSYFFCSSRKQGSEKEGGRGHF